MAEAVASATYLDVNRLENGRGLGWVAEYL